MRISYNVTSDVGLVRDNNEDMALVFGEKVRNNSASFSFDAPENLRFAAVVADGMGGYSHGEVASEMALTSFNRFFDELPSDLELNTLIMRLKEWTAEVNEEIMNAAEGSGMGCTFTGLLLYESHALLVNIGDSRTYRYRYGVFKQMTSDHSERNRLNDPSLPSNLIYNALGLEYAFIDITPTKVVPGDRFVICSDGLTDMVEDSAIETLVSTEEPTSRLLVNEALKNGGEDNVTVIVLNFI